MHKMTDEEFHCAIYDIVKKHEGDPNTCFAKIMKLTYPGSKDCHPKLEHAKFFYEKYCKIAKEIKMDKDFTKKAYEQNKKIFQDAYLSDYKPSK